MKTDEELRESSEGQLKLALKRGADQARKSLVIEVQKAWNDYQNLGCGSCYYYAGEECYRNPPIPHLLSDGRIHRTRPPVMEGGRACGEWKPIPLNPESMTKSKPEVQDDG